MLKRFLAIGTLILGCLGVSHSAGTFYDPPSYSTATGKATTGLVGSYYLYPSTYNKNQYTVISGTGGVFTTFGVKATTMTATTYYGDGSNLTGIISGAGGASSLGVFSDEVIITSPTSQINFKGTGVAVVQNGSTATVTVGGGSFANLTDVNDSGKTLNYVPKWNGSEIVWAAYNASFSFAIASFSDSLSSTIEIGAGTWKAIGAVSFTATYSNGPATGGYVSKSGWAGNLTMTSSFQGPTTNTEAVSYPSVAGTVVFTLNATNGTDSPTSAITHTFYNNRHWGVSTVASGYTEANVEALAGSELSNSKAKSFTVAPGATEYIVFAYPSRLGTATFTVGGFEGGFNSPETVSVTNASGYTENYYVYRSANPNLGSTAVTTS